MSDIERWTRNRAATGPRELVALVISHAHAPISSWSPLLLPPEQVTSLLGAAAGCRGVKGVAVLATCSRTELYAELGEGGAGAATLRSLLQEALGLSPEVAALPRELHGAEAVHHLLRVASGLESIALGEHEVLGQVRDALHAAQGARVAGPLVQRLFERALATGARARHHTGIGRGALTLGAAAADAITEGGPPSRCALAVVVGAGQMARQAARHLRDRGIARLAIVNRTAANATALAREVGGLAHPVHALPGLLAQACAVVAAVRVAAPVITPSTLLHARLRLDEPLQLVDLGSPPNIDPACARIPGVRRLDLDALHARMAATHAARAEAATAALAIVQDEGERFLAWWRHRQLVPAACRLRERFREEARVVVERETRHLRGEERAQLERFADALVRRLLHGPLTHLRSLAARDERSDDSSHADDPSRVIIDAYLDDLSAELVTPPRS